MMKFNRGLCPECLLHKDKNGKINCEKWNEKWTEQLKKNTSARFSWHQYQNQPVNEILIDDLRTMSDSHCAFCDKYAPEHDSDSIEHFLPKKLYPSFAFTWENLFLCCGGCQKRPKNWKDYHDKLALVLKPDKADYSFDRYFRFDTRDGEIKVNEWNDSEIDRERASITIIYFQLNGFKRPKVRLDNFKKFYDAKEPNKIKKEFDGTLNELPYRFIYM